MRFEAGHLLALLLGGLFGILVGIFLGSGAEVEGATEPVVLASAPSEDGAAELAPVLRELREISRRLDSLAMEAPRDIAPRPWEGASEEPAAPAAVRVPVPAQESERERVAVVELPEELTEWMERIDERLTTVGTLNANQIIPPRPGAVVVPPPHPTLDDDEQETFEKSHYLWSLQDVVDTYGMPDVVHGEGTSIEWEYKYDPPVGDLDDMHFVFTGGLCIRAYAH